MTQYISRTSLMSAWCLGLVAVLWSTAAVMSTVQTVAVAVIGVAMAVVPFLLARQPAQTTAEAIRAVQTERDR